MCGAGTQVKHVSDVGITERGSIQREDRKDEEPPQQRRGKVRACIADQITCRLQQPRRHVEAGKQERQAAAARGSTNDVVYLG